MLRRLANINNSHLIVLGGADIAAKGSLFAVSALLARNLGASNFGDLAWSQALIGLVSVGVELGLPGYGSREIAARPDNARWFVHKICAIRIVGAVIAFVCVTLAALLKVDETSRGVLIISAIWLFPYAFSCEWVLQGTQRIRSVALVRGVGAASLLLGACIWYALGLGVWAAAAIRVCAEIATALFGLVMVRSAIGSTSGNVQSSQSSVEMVLGAAPLMVAGLVSSIYAANVDTIILGRVRPAEEVGMYAAAQRLYLGIVVPTKLLLFVYYPRFSRAYALGGSGAITAEMRAMARLTCVVVLPLIVYVYAMSGPIVEIVFGPAYTQTADMLRLMCVAAGAVACGAAAPNVLIAARQERAAIACFGAGLITSISLNCMIIPAYGAVGAACVLVLSEAAVVMCAAFTAVRVLQIPFRNCYDATALLGVVATGGAVAAAKAIADAYNLGPLLSLVLAGAAALGAGVAWYRVQTTKNARTQ